MFNNSGGNISASKEVTSTGFNTKITTGTSQDTSVYSIEGRKVEVKNQLPSSLTDGNFTSFSLQNSQISSNSIVLGSFTGNTAGAITGSIITAATIAASTASVQIHNETGQTIPDDTGYTASFIVL